jgi:hypothetical protein
MPSSFVQHPLPHPGKDLSMRQSQVGGICMKLIIDWQNQWLRADFRFDAIACRA